MESIDLGLPSGNLWCEINLGAEKIGENGKWAAWGGLELHGDKEIEEFTMFSNDGHDYRLAENNIITKYNLDDHLEKLEPEDDIATQLLGPEFSIPGKDDFQELIENTEFSIATFNNYKCAKLKSKINNAEIYFPVPGWCANGKVECPGEGGIYMTADLTPNPMKAYVAVVDGGNGEMTISGSGLRLLGVQVRAIKRKVNET